MARNHLRPLFDRVVIKELEPDRMRQSGLVVPPGSHEPPPQHGIVRAGRHDEARLTHAVGLELLDHDAVEERSQVVARHLPEPNARFPGPRADRRCVTARVRG